MPKKAFGQAENSLKDTISPGDCTALHSTLQLAPGLVPRRQVVCDDVRDTRKTVLFVDLPRKALQPVF